MLDVSELAPVSDLNQNNTHKFDTTRVLSALWNLCESNTFDLGS